jgi:hypothetical protein
MFLCGLLTPPFWFFEEKVVTDVVVNRPIPIHIYNIYLGWGEMSLRNWGNSSAMHKQTHTHTHSFYR